VLVFALHTGFLVFFAEEAVAYREGFDLSAHEAAECIFGKANNGLAADVEAGVDDDRAPCALFELRDQSVIAGVGVAMDGLDAR